MSLTDELLWALSLLVMFAFAWLGWLREKRAWKTWETAKRLRWQRDCLEDWLKADGWRVSYEGERVAITRGSLDDQEARLRPVRREKE